MAPKSMSQWTSSGIIMMTGAAALMVMMIVNIAFASVYDANYSLTVGGGTTFHVKKFPIFTHRITQGVTDIQLGAVLAVMCFVAGVTLLCIMGYDNMTIPFVVLSGHKYNQSLVYGGMVLAMGVKDIFFGR